MRIVLLFTLLVVALVVQGDFTAEFSGQKLLQSAEGGYLRAAFRGPNDDREWFVDTTQRRKHCTKWHVEEHNGKVALRSAYFKGMYLRARPGGIVDLDSQLLSSEMWSPVKTRGGKWSLQSNRGSWLRFKQDGNVTLQEEINGEAQFYLEDW